MAIAILGYAGKQVTLNGGADIFSIVYCVIKRVVLIVDLPQVVFLSDEVGPLRKSMLIGALKLLLLSHTGQNY